ncbi:hypothetical protein Lfu02_45950 [Longispora fulva]|uniref:Uncharacterized protein n=1 Tax=Longispora fulva TaxID=619741 RepID=A0A8J7KH16_9ACTN|nr:hypothetical protein [Longispora fulva]MBG6137970.1 hypothetical protein [Longispora fulva]GIG60223.1 hypothetical protein Lfu02_45950 [Longispora fulva]
MDKPWQYLPPRARAIATAATEGVEAARAGDPEAFGAAAGRLAEFNPEQIRLVLGAVVRALLEDQHADGLTGDDVQAALGRCVRSAIAWFPDLDVNVLIVLVTGALGVHPEEGEIAAPAPLAVAQHATLLVSDLVTAADRPLHGYLAASLAEIARAETMEMP